MKEGRVPGTVKKIGFPHILPDLSFAILGSRFFVALRLNHIIDTLQMIQGTTYDNTCVKDYRDLSMLKKLADSYQ